MGSEQTPLLPQGRQEAVEISYNFKRKWKLFWGVGGFRFRNGGETLTLPL